MIRESLGSLEATLPPTPLKALLAADGARVHVYSHDTALVGAVQEAAGDGYSVQVVDDWSRLAELIRGGLGHIVLLDAEAAPDSVEAGIAELRMLEPLLVVLLAARPEAAGDHIGLLSDRLIHRLLIKPADIGITRLLLESAVWRYFEVQNEAKPDPKAGLDALDRRQTALLASTVPASELAMLDFEPPVYPAAALRRNIEGWVDLEFVVDDGGRTRDIEIVGAEPPRVFEEAALAAVAAYRYVPYELDGRRYARKVSLRVRFTLE